MYQLLDYYVFFSFSTKNYRNLNFSSFFVTAHKCMWTITNYFLLNLTLSDLLMATFNMIPSFLFMRDRSTTINDYGSRQRRKKSVKSLTLVFSTLTASIINDSGSPVSHE